MEIKFYKNKSETIKVNKDIELLNTVTDNYGIGDVFNEENPEITFNNDDIEWNADYAEFEGLYYFITGFRHLDGNRTVITFNLDYLYTYSDLIENAEAYIDRASNNYEDYVRDTKVLTSTKVVQERLEFDEIFNDQEESGCYILVTSQSGYSQL